MLSRRTFLKGISMTGAAVQVGLPPLAAMFNLNGTAYAAEAAGKVTGIDKRFLLWCNGNGIPERYWIPRETGENYELTPCLVAARPRARLRARAQRRSTTWRRGSTARATATSARCAG